ncbi:hypothetical protein GC170_15995 [bacterium]|nr:hypothetical protein [bacterium]
MPLSPLKPTGLTFILILGILSLSSKFASAQEPSPDVAPDVFVDLPLEPNSASSDSSPEENPDGSNTEAEERENFIETDRNAFTFSRLTTGRNVRVFESAYSYINIGSEGAKHSFPETLLRIGLTERFEARIGYNFETGPETEAAEGDVVGGFGANAEQQVLYGFKYQVTRRNREYRLMPDSAFLIQGHTPIGSLEGQTQVRLGYSWGWELPRGMQFDQAIRFGTDREFDDRYNLWAPSAVLRIPLVESRRWFTQIEYFSIMSDGREIDFSKQFIDTGLHYLPTPNFEIGGIVAFGINEQTRGILINFGFGYRF